MKTINHNPTKDETPIFYWYLKVLKQYARFGGRSRRKEFWIFTLTVISINLVCLAIDNLLGITILNSLFGPFFITHNVIISVPALAVTVRRLQDIGENVNCILLILIPVIGTIWLIILLIKNSDPFKNQYGICPKKRSFKKLALYYQ